MSEEWRFNKISKVHTALPLSQTWEWRVKSQEDVQESHSSSCFPDWGVKSEGSKRCPRITQLFLFPRLGSEEWRLKKMSKNHSALPLSQTGEWRVKAKKMSKNHTALPLSQTWGVKNERSRICLRIYPLPFTMWRSEEWRFKEMSEITLSVSPCWKWWVNVQALVDVKNEPLFLHAREYVKNLPSPVHM